MKILEYDDIQKLSSETIQDLVSRHILYMRQEKSQGSTWETQIVTLAESEALQVGSVFNGKLEGDYYNCQYSMISQEQIENGLIEDYWQA